MSAYRTAAPLKSLPARCAMRLDELPRASQDRLIDVTETESASYKRERHTRVYAILAVGTGLFALLGVTLWSQSTLVDETTRYFERRTPWNADEITTVTAACFIIGVFLLGGIASLIRQYRAPVGTFWYAHKAYLIDCSHDRVVAYPLALLDDQEVMGDTVHLSFGDIDLQIPFDSPGDAGSFLSPLRGNATAAAACLARGDRDAILQGGFIPDALLYRETPRIPFDRAWVPPLAAGVLLALAGRLVLPGLHASIAEARFVAACQQNHAVCAEYQAAYPGGAHLDDVDDAYFVWTIREKEFGRYREAFPAGRHLNDAAIAADDTSARALAAYRNSAERAKEQGDPRLVSAILTTLRVLHAAHTTSLPLQFTGDVDPDISHWNRDPDARRTPAEAGVDPEIAGLPPFIATTAKDTLRSVLLDAVGVTGAIDLHDPQPFEDVSHAPVQLSLTYRIFRGKGAYKGETRRQRSYAEIDIDWTLTFRWPGEPGMGEVSVTIHTAPSPTFNAFVREEGMVYSSMLIDDAKNLGPALQRALGLASKEATAPE